MRLKVGGVRGSFPVARPEFMHYGGETTSLLVEGEDKTAVLLDLGSGVRPLGVHLDRAGVQSVLVLITHYHLDHLIGLPALPLLYRKGSRVEFAAAAHPGHSVGSVLHRFLSKPFWPLDLKAMEARIRFTDLPGDLSRKPRRRGGLQIRWCPVHHPAGCTAFRIDEPDTGASLVFATDLEWSLSTPGERDRFLRFASTPRPPGILLFDAHIRPGDEDRYRNWGHSTWRDAVEVGRATGAGRVAAIHHAPEHTDAELARMEKAFRRELPSGCFARADAEFTIGS